MKKNKLRYMGNDFDKIFTTFNEKETKKTQTQKRGNV